MDISQINQLTISAYNKLAEKYPSGHID